MKFGVRKWYKNC